MARKFETNHRNEKAKIRIFYAEAEGGDDAIQELIKGLTTTISRAGQTGAPPKQLPATVRAAAPTDPLEAKTLFESDDAPPQNGEPEDATPEREPAEISRRRRGDGPKRDYNAGIEVVGDLDFVPEGKAPLKEFFADKGATKDVDQVLVICDYLQYVLETPTYGVAHVLAGFRHLAERIPADLRSTARNLKDKKGWLAYSDVNNIRVTTEGHNRVQHDLGRG